MALRNKVARNEQVQEAIGKEDIYTLSKVIELGREFLARFEFLIKIFGFGFYPLPQCFDAPGSRLISGS